MRLARTSSDAQALFATIIGVISEEKLGLNVTYVSCGNKLTCTLAMNGCVGYMQETCTVFFTLEENMAAFAQGQKAFNDSLADVMFLTATREDYLDGKLYRSSGLNVDSLPSLVTGPSGFTEVYGVYAFPEDLDAIRLAHGLEAEWFEAFAASEARQLMHNPADLDAFGVLPLASHSCNSSDSHVEAAMAIHRTQGWVCYGVWWLNPSCAALGSNWSSQCLAVVEDSWDSKAFLWQALFRSRVPLAKQVLAPASWWNVVHLGQRSAVFVWRWPRSLLEHRRPVRLALKFADEPRPDVIISAASTLAFADSEFTRLMFAGRLLSEYLDPLMLQAGEARAAGHAGVDKDLFYRKLACDWLRAHSEVWSPWLADFACPRGTFFNETTEECEFCSRGRTGKVFPNGTAYCSDCPPGTSSRIAWLDCTPCEAGRYANSSNNQDCTECAPGWHAPSEGFAVCEACAAGTIAPLSGGRDCLVCGPGFTSAAGSSQCEACEPGTYANNSGSNECTSCGPGLVTVLRGATLPSQCVCDEETLQEVGSDDCSPCPSYFRCRPGSNVAEFAKGETVPLSLQPGYMSLLEDPLQIYRCSPASACPGSRPGSCAENRNPNSVACGRGLPNTYKDNEGFHKCTSPTTDAVFLVVFIAFAAIGLLAFSFATSRDLQDQTNSGLLVTVLCGVSFSAFQTMGVFNSLSVTWFEPLRTIFSVMSLASLDLQYLHLGCLTPVDPITTYTARQLVAPISVPVMLLSLLIRSLSRRRPVDLLPELVNAVGAVFTLFFTSIMISSATPFICYPHPVGDRSSMVSETSILCFEDPVHWAMVSVSIFSLLLIAVPFLAVSAYGSFKYPMLIASPLEKHARMLRAFRFLYMRFRPQCHYYGLVMSARSVCICLVPVLPGVRDDSALQFCFLASVLISFIMVQLWILPWRSVLPNLVDGVLMTCNLQLLVCSAINTDFKDKSAIGKFGTMVFVAFSVLVVGGCFSALRWYLLPNPFYNYFICHHKRGAAAQARLLKIHIQELSKSTVFIDSDDLLELDKLFDVVKTKVGKLVVYLTRETLMRPWCAGEILTALRAGREVAVIKTASFVAPSEEELQNMTSYIDLSGCNLAQYGIDLEDVADGYRKLLSDSTPQLVLPRGGTFRWKAVAVSLLKNGKLTELHGWSSLRGTSTASQDTGAFIISSDFDSDEAIASAAVVQSMIRKYVIGISEPTPIICLADLVLDGLHTQLEQVAQARAICVLLSAGSLHCLPQVLVMVQLMLQGGKNIIPVRLPGFKFPDETYFTRDLHTLWPGKDKSIPEVQMRAFFKRIAMTLEIAGPAAIVNKQIDAIFSRIDTGPLSNIEGDMIPNEIIIVLATLRGVQTRMRRSHSGASSRSHWSLLSAPQEEVPVAVMPQKNIIITGKEMMWPECIGTAGWFYRYHKESV